jgi:hypothetical protein
MTSEIPLALQTAYAELLERTAAADFDRAFGERGTFVTKEIKGRRYWYFQTLARGTKKQRYVGPETPELLERIASARRGIDDFRERRSLVSTLARSAFLPKPSSEMGEVIAQLAEAGVFRLRAILVGTVAFQTYSAMLGVRLPNAAARTDDVDIAQDRSISIATHDQTLPIIDILRKADPAFRNIPNLHGASSFSYGNEKIRVDILTPNRGAESDKPVNLRALGSSAQQLRFLDFLIRNPEPAVLLHDGGVLVNVPAPERYAVHKLIVAERRIKGTGKSEKDLRQASALIAALVRKRRAALKDSWEEASSRGKKWRQLMLAGLGAIHSGTRDEFLHATGETRSHIPGLDLHFEDARPHNLLSTDNLGFRGISTGATVNFAISLAALKDHFGAAAFGKADLLDLFGKHRAEIEAMARKKYLEWPIEDPALTLIKTGDIARLRQQLAKGRSAAPRKS